MSRLALAVAAASLVPLSACCWWDGPSGACVTESVWGQVRCAEFQEQICMWDEEAPAPSPLLTCGGSFYGGESCADRGFTHRCESGSWVRPADPC